MRRFDLRSLRFGAASEAWCSIPVEVDPFQIGGDEYRVADGAVQLQLSVSRVDQQMTVSAVLETVVHGPCFRCLEDAALSLTASAEEYARGGESEGVEDGDEAYIGGYILQADVLARDMIAGALPAKIVCREDCRGLCPRCGANLNEAVDHGHEAADE
jgi:uncharacterized protein